MRRYQLLWLCLFFCIGVVSLIRPTFVLAAGSDETAAVPDNAQGQDVQLGQDGKPADYVGGLLDSFVGGSDDGTTSGFTELSGNLPSMIPDLASGFVKVSRIRSLAGALWVLAGLVIMLAVISLAERWLVRWLGRKYLQLDSGDTELTAEPGILEKLSGGLVRIIPELLGLVILVVLSLGCYSLFFHETSRAARTVFAALLLILVFYRIVELVARIMFAPQNLRFRLVPVTDRNAGIVVRLIVWTFSYIFAVLIIGSAFARTGSQPESVMLFRILGATILLIGVAIVAVRYRQEVASHLLASTPEHPEPPSWGRRNFAEIWHICFILYCALLWIMMVNSSTDPGSRTKGAFLISFFILPIWLILDKILTLIVRNGIGMLKIYDVSMKDSPDDAPEVTEQRRKGLEILRKTLGITRFLLILILIAWLAHLWGYSLPFVATLTRAIFDSIVIIALALMVWRFVSNWIERKIAEEEGEPQEVDEDSADEFGAAVTRGRAYTLLPILRKFVGVVLAVMVTLTVLSSLGVNIGPLLAGAGVVGLAVGFGAQKIVADIFSGFFYLFDDAFRVGEYLQTGSVSGTVESISLRNVMLRHHRGMLQIVPHSELGTITNYMRGGIIEKFNLDFPYDADIDKIRKIIKKVGISMMENPEFADDFLAPVKSQGVREISNSVMTIRVKFTARPGKHFVIRREAFKRITEALSAKGIHYAHRKVIVDIPQVTGEISKDNETLVTAAGAAAEQALADDTTKP